MIVHFRFSDAVAKQAGLLWTLLEFQGVTVAGGTFSEPEPQGDSDFVLIGLAHGAPELAPDNREAEWERALVMILDPGPEKPPPGILEFSSDGLQRLLRRLGRPLRGVSERPATAEERRRPGPERRRWDLKRFRYGLWLEFARSTGAGKFDPYPLMNSKRSKIESALAVEMRKYAYTHESDGEQLLASALDHVWESFDDRFPCAVHVVDAIAEHIWEAASPRMPDRRHYAKQGDAEATASLIEQESALERAGVIEA